MTTDSLTSFLEGILDGSVEPTMASEEIPENDMDGNVKIVVGKSFDAIVRDPTKDVLIEVYAPWCGHCKSLEPIYKELADTFADIDSVVIAKMDGTQNEHPALEVEGYPAIFMFPAIKGNEGAGLTRSC